MKSRKTILHYYACNVLLSLLSCLNGANFVKGDNAFRNFSTSGTNVRNVTKQDIGDNVISGGRQYHQNNDSVYNNLENSPFKQARYSDNFTKGNFDTSVGTGYYQLNLTTLPDNDHNITQLLISSHKAGNHHELTTEGNGATANSSLHVLSTTSPLPHLRTNKTILITQAITTTQDNFANNDTFANVLQSSKHRNTTKSYKIQELINHTDESITLKNITFSVSKSFDDGVTLNNVDGFSREIEGRSEEENEIMITPQTNDHNRQIVETITESFINSTAKTTQPFKENVPKNTTSTIKTTAEGEMDPEAIATEKLPNSVESVIDPGEDLLGISEAPFTGDGSMEEFTTTQFSRNSQDYLGPFNFFVTEKAYSVQPSNNDQQTSYYNEREPVEDTPTSRESTTSATWFYTKHDININVADFTSTSETSSTSTKRSFRTTASKSSTDRDLLETTSTATFRASSATVVARSESSLTMGEPSTIEITTDPSSTLSKKSFRTVTSKPTIDRDILTTTSATEASSPTIFATSESSNVFDTNSSEVTSMYTEAYTLSTESSPAMEETSTIKTLPKTTSTVLDWSSTIEPPTATAMSDNEGISDVAFEIEELSKSCPTKRKPIGKYNASLTVKWKYLCHPKDMPVFMVNITGKYSEDDNVTFFDQRSTTLKDTCVKKIYNFNVTFINLKASFVYTIYLWKLNGKIQDVISNTQVTGEDCPAAPLVEEKEIISTTHSAYISWKPPAEGGIVRYYTVKATPLNPSYYIPLDCARPTYKTRTCITQNLGCNLTNLAEGYNYEIKTHANTSAGDGPQSLPVIVKTEIDGLSLGTPRALKLKIFNQTNRCEDYNSTFFISWKYPCDPKGNISFFKIQLIAKGHEDNIHLKSQPLDNKLELFPAQFFESFTNLNSSYTYKISVWATNTEDPSVKGNIVSLIASTGNCEGSSNKALAIGLSVGFVIIILAGGIFFIWWRKHKKEQKEVVDVKPLKVINTPEPIPVKKFSSYYNKTLKEPDILKLEFGKLFSQAKEFKQLKESLFALKPENKRKNRYLNILPYDMNRVKLKIEEDDEMSSDYINASYIKGYTREAEYIATQGPMEVTCADFWKMVMQENVTLIVMVTLVEEYNKVKCYQYFPLNKDSLKVGNDIEITCCSIIKFDSYCVRKLTVRKDKYQYNVEHMQFLGWPDFGCPKYPEQLLEFRQDMRRRSNSESPIVIHCSAGVGRTGTLIALDILLQAIQKESKISIYDVVLNLRKQRANMVQADVQYIFLHACINTALEMNAKGEMVEDHTREPNNMTASNPEEEPLSEESETPF